MQLLWRLGLLSSSSLRGRGCLAYPAFFCDLVCVGLWAEQDRKAPYLEQQPILPVHCREEAAQRTAETRTLKEEASKCMEASQ